MKPTKQQQAVIERKVDKGEILLVNAYAGSGKTTTLELVTRARPESRFLYLCFNHDNAVKARRSFPKNCECRTAHSVAWHAVGRHHKKIDQLRPRTVMELFGLAAPHLAVYAINTLNAFLHSADAAISPRHLDVAPKTPTSVRNAVIRVAEKIWKRMRDPDDDKLPVSHDGYLKIWALESPEITAYDVILLDEAQDTNPVTLKIVLDQVERRSAGLILVGDTHQAIYAWRHAINAMESVRKRASWRLPLTESFRFVPGIAADAGIVLNRLKRDSVTLIGRGDPERKAAEYAVLARANASLIEAAFEKARDGVPIHFAATKREDSWDPFIPYKFQITLDTYCLWRGRRNEVRDPYMKKFRSFAEVEEHARGEGEQRHGRDVELGLQTQLVKKFGDEIPRLLKQLQRGSVAPEDARLTFSTAHRAKGLEWDCVRLLDDFLDPADTELHKELEPQVLAEESNILYVAITRARLKVKYPAKLLDWFHAQAPESRNAGHRFPPEPRDAASAGNAPVSEQPARSPGVAGALDLPEISRRIAEIPQTKITKNLHPNLRDTRRQYPRAYEPWSDEEDALLMRAWALEPDPVQLAAVFRRNIGAVSSRAGHLGLD